MTTRAVSSAAHAGRDRRAPSRRVALLLPLALAVVVAAVLVVADLARSGGPAAPDTSHLQYVGVARRELAGLRSQGISLGSASAPVVIQEFGDLRCPVCREFDAQTLPDVVTRLVRTGQVRLEYHHWPILGSNSVYAGQAAYAAAQQNRLLLYAQIVYFNQGDEQQSWFTPTVARAVAAAAGLDLSRFDHDLADTAAADRATAAANATAQRNGFTGTPSFHITGPGGVRNLTGSLPGYDAIAKVVQQVAR